MRQRVKRQVQKAINIDGRVYKTYHTAARAFAEIAAMNILDIIEDKMAIKDDADWNLYYDLHQKTFDDLTQKAYRRSVPIFKNFFEEKG